MERFNVKFSRHEFSPLQLKEIGEIHLDLSDLASLNITTLEEAKRIYDEMLRLITTASSEVRGVYLYGVIPSPLRFQMCQDSAGVSQSGWILVHEAFNVNRSPEGQKPTFEHLCWLETGLYFPSKLWSRR